MKTDPFAPATSDRHVKNALRVQPPLDAGNDPDLVREHVTPSELLANQMPDREELERRRTLIEEFRAELEEHGETQNPTLVDLTDAEHVWHWVEPQDTQDGYFAWLPVAELAEVEQDAEQDAEPTEAATQRTEGDETPSRTAKRPRKGAKPQQDLDAALAKLKAGKGRS